MGENLARPFTTEDGTQLPTGIEEEKYTPVSIGKGRYSRACLIAVGNVIDFPEGYKSHYWEGRKGAHSLPAVIMTIMVFYTP